MTKKRMKYFITGVDGKERQVNEEIAQLLLVSPAKFKKHIKSIHPHAAESHYFNICEAIVILERRKKDLENIAEPF